MLNVRILLLRPHLHIRMNDIMRLVMKTTTQHSSLNIFTRVVAKRHICLGALVAVMLVVDIHHVWPDAFRIGTAVLGVVSVIGTYDQLSEFAFVAAAVAG